MKHKPIEIPQDIADKYTHAGQHGRFKDALGHILSQAVSEPETPHEPKKRGRPRKQKE